jgi:hypothetical protein
MKIKGKKTSNIFNYRGINDFKKGYQPRTIIVKDSCRLPQHYGEVEELSLPDIECTWG